MTADKRLSVDDLSPDQHEVYAGIETWLQDAVGMANPFSHSPECEKDILKVGGLAGSGKSTLIGIFAASTVLKVAYVSFTGKAASVLKRKLAAAGVGRLSDKPYSGEIKHGSGSKWFTSDPNSVFCGTIHRLIYKPMINGKEELLGFEKRAELDRNYDLIVIDEASMVSDEMLTDLKVHQVPLLAVGDHGQLPPVMSSGELMKSPDLKLEKIHRQAADNPIIKFAHHLRSTGKIDRSVAGDAIDFAGLADLSKVLREAYGLTGSHGEPGKPLASIFDVGILCWTNRRRIQLNGAARKVLGFAREPKAGEVVVCLRNTPPIYNGMRGVVIGDARRDDRLPWKLHASVSFPEEGLSAMATTFCEPQFLRERTFKDLDELQSIGVDAERMSDGGQLYDFGYAMTVHKSQGSQFRHVVWVLDRPARSWDEEWRRFAYTAATRASDRLTIVT